MSKIYGASIAHVHVKQPEKKKKVVVAAVKHPVETLPVAVKEIVQPVVPAPKVEVPKVENVNVPKSESK